MPARERPRARPPPGDPAAARAERRSRALEEPLDIQPRADPRFLHLEIRNPVRETRYDVLFPEFPSTESPFCTCTDFARRGIGTCKHIEAARIWLADHRGDLPPSPARPAGAGIWEEIDRRERGMLRLKAPAPRRIRYAGEALLTAS